MHDVVYDGLALRYTAAHGIGGANVKRITVRDCDISWIGGGYLYFDNAGRGVRYGNGIEFWANCEDVLVVSNRLWECYDAGLTNQSNEDGAVQRNIVWRGNEVWNCEYSYEYWQQGEGAKTARVIIEDNVFRDAGKGWGHRQRWNPNAAHLMFYDTTAATQGFVVRRNKFLRSENVLFRLFNDWRASMDFKDNEWVTGGEPICRYHGRPTRDLVYKYPDRLDCMHDDNLSEIESQGAGARVFAADELDGFLSFLHRPAASDLIETFVDDLDLSCSRNACGTATGVRRSAIDGKPLRIGGKIYARGIGTRAEGAVGIRLDGNARSFDAEVGVDAFAAEARRGDRRIAVVFRVWTDGRIAWQSSPIGETSAPVPVHVDLAGVRELLLETSSDAPWVAFDAGYGIWADARVTGGGKVDAIMDEGAVRQLGILTPPECPKPHFNGADIWGVRPGRPVLFRVPVSGERPMRFTAKGLPQGVTFDAAKGILGGVAPHVKGDYDIEVTAENAKGCATRTIRLAVGDTICLTPPMGWNSWNIWGPRFTGEHARTAARALDESGLGDYGWSFVNLDDFWEMNNSPRNADRPELRGAARDADGNILSNPSFPDMKALTDCIHSFGFKAGLYSSPGPTTCGGCEGSYGYEMQDARRWAEWGFDYVKYDWCSYDTVIADQRGGKAWYDDDNWRDVRDELKERPYRLMRDCLLAQNRDIVYSFCQYGMGRAWEWAREAGANCWRSWEDMKDSWPWMMKAMESRNLGAENYWKYAGPGCWIDPDMMIVGDQRSCGWTHPTFLTPNEQYTHVSLWAMLGAPLLIGCDLTKLDAFTRNLLMNGEVIAVSQDRLGKVARCVRRTDAESVWARPLADGNTAVALVNHYPLAREIKVNFAELGLGGEMWVKDLWRQKCEGRHYGAYSSVVPPHATTLIKVCKIPCPRCD
jgi:alpha-galactosidase